MADEDENGRGLTRRIVLRRELVIAVPEGADPEKVAEAQRVFGASRAKQEPVEAWVVCGEFDGATKRAAIEAYAGKAGTADAKVGLFRAPGKKAWSGGVEHVAPPRPLIEARTVE